jgi:hypothetical protein
MAPYLRQAMEGQMKRLMKAVSMAGIAALLLGAPAWGADDEVETTVQETQTLVVPPAPFDPVVVGWYEISALAGVPQEAVAFDQAGEELMRETNPAVSGRVSEWWCALFTWVKDRCDKCAEVAANAGCNQ